MILQRESHTPSWLAPRVAFDVVIESIAEQSVLAQDVVYLGAGWSWEQKANVLRRPTCFALVEQREWRSLPAGTFELSMADRAALCFAGIRF